MNQRELPKVEDLAHTLHLTLEEIYNGTEKLFEVIRQKICDRCNGTGSQIEFPEIDTCEKCHGFPMRRSKIPRSQTASGSTENCKFCWGKGRTVIPEHRCTNCFGRGVILTRSKLKLEIQCGTPHGYTMICEGKGSQEPNKSPGHILVLLESLSHNTYRRVGDDLITTMQLDLTEALCGFTKELVTLDKRTIRIIHPPGNVIHDYDQKCIVGEGMPKFKAQNEKGKLIIKFVINYPETFRSRFVPTVTDILGHAPKLDIPMTALERNMVELDINSIGNYSRAQDYEEYNGENQEYAEGYAADYEDHQHNYEDYDNENQAYADGYAPDYGHHGHHSQENFEGQNVQNGQNGAYGYGHHSRDNSDGYDNQNHAYADGYEPDYGHHSQHNSDGYNRQDSAYDEAGRGDHSRHSRFYQRK